MIHNIENVCPFPRVSYKRAAVSVPVAAADLSTWAAFENENNCFAASSQFESTNSWCGKAITDTLNAPLLLILTGFVLQRWQVEYCTVPWRSWHSLWYNCCSEQYEGIRNCYCRLCIRAARDGKVHYQSVCRLIFFFVWGGGSKKTPITVYHVPFLNMQNLKIYSLQWVCIYCLEYPVFFPDDTPISRFWGTQFCYVYVRLILVMVAATTCAVMSYIIRKFSLLSESINCMNTHNRWVLKSM